MELKEHEGKSLKYITIRPDGYNPEVEYPLVILLHGFGAGMHDLTGLCPAIDRAGYLYACPNGPLPFEIGLGQAGYGWATPRSEKTEEESQRSVGLLESTFEEVMERYRVAPGQVLLLGFSQGGGMTYRCGLPKPENFAGLAALSSGFPDREDLRDSLPAQRTQPIFISHGVYDEIAPVDLARQAKAFLEEEGYRPQYKEYPMRHEISQEVMEDLVPWIKGVLPPATA